MEYSFILVGPKVPENIGASARALKTMGFESLVLIKPCDDPEERALWLAHGSHDIIQKARIYNSLQEARDNFDLLVATTTRKRKIKEQLVPLAGLKSFLGKKGETVSRVALVFGNEESGLSNSDLALCDIASEIPMAVDFPSLNLSQAVMLYAYTLSDSRERQQHINAPAMPEENSYRVIRDKVGELLRETGIAGKPALSGRIFERLAHADEKDLNLIHSLSSVILDIIKNKKKD